MKKNLALIRNLVWLICVLIFAWSCEQSSAPPPKPKVVRKKIVADKDKTVAIRKVKKTPPVKSKPSTQPQPVTTVQKSQVPEQPATKPQATSPTIIAKKDETVAAQKPKPQPAKTKRPAIQPKSDISILKKPERQAKPPKVASKTAKTASDDLSDDTKMAAVEPPRYSAQDRIDPFEPLFKKKRGEAKVWKPKRGQRVPRTPLERIDLGQLKLVAIVEAKSGNKAMVEESSGKGYVIEKGTYIGTNAGKVVSIDMNKVLVKEEFEDNMGNVKVRDTELKLLKPAGEF
ncbi:MAG: pilus assembly protein PilP [Desulfobacterales bacterium]|jgi:type IV pilus assembly protein PilP